MLDAKKIKDVVEKNRNYLEISTRVNMENMVMLVADLFKADGNDDMYKQTIALYDKLENMDTDEFVNEHIW